jgi:hypothetical protein
MEMGPHRIFRLLGAAVAGTVVYRKVLRPRHQRWGATADEVAEQLPGDDEVANPSYVATRAITIGAAAEDVWPWIAQIGYVGYGRGGWYAFDFWDADAGRGSSTARLIPAAQELHVGLVIGEEGFTVRSFEVNRHLVMSWHYPEVQWVVKDGLWPKFGECSMVFVLRQLSERSTRLLIRTRLDYGRLGIHALWWPLFDIGDFFQQWRMLPAIKRRAEDFARERATAREPVAVGRVPV